MFNESDFKKHLSTGEFKNLYLLYGEEKMLVKRSTEQLLKKLSGGTLSDFNYHAFSSDVSINELSLAVDILPFMSELNIVRVVDLNADKLSTADFQSLMQVLGSVPATTVLILAMPTLDTEPKANMKKLIAYIDKHGVCVELRHHTGLQLERDLCRWAKAGGCTMSELTAHHLVMTAGGELNILNSELKKLCAYADGGEITPEMIDRLVPKTVEGRVYDLFGYIIAVNTDRALSTLDALLYQQTSAMSICTVLSREYIDAYRVRCAAESGVNTAQIAEDFGYGRRAWVLNKKPSQIRRVTTAALRRSIDELTAVSERLVTTAVNERVELEKLVCKLALFAEDKSDD